MPPMIKRRVLLRLLIGLFLLAIAFVFDRHGYTVLRTLTLYEHSGEIREGLTAAKFLGSGIGTLLVTVLVGCLDPKGWRRAACLAAIVVAASAAASVFKITCGRERPSHQDQVPGHERFAFRGPALGLHEGAVSPVKSSSSSARMRQRRQTLRIASWQRTSGGSPGAWPGVIWARSDRC